MLLSVQCWEDALVFVYTTSFERSLESDRKIYLLDAFNLYMILGGGCLEVAVIPNDQQLTVRILLENRLECL